MLKAVLALPASMSQQIKENLCATKLHRQICGYWWAGGSPALPGVSRMTDMVMREQTTRMTIRAMAIPFQFLCGGLTPPRSYGEKADQVRILGKAKCSILQHNHIEASSISMLIQQWTCPRVILHMPPVVIVSVQHTDVKMYEIYFTKK